AQDANQATGPWARLGLRFEYDPPPGPVTGFRLGVGDQSVHVFFDPPKVNDLDYMLVHFSYNRSDLDSITGDSGTIEGVDGRVICSSGQSTIENWKGGYVIAPIRNGTPLYVRVQSFDNSGQASINDPEALAKTPYRTTTLQEALGATNSCSLTPQNSLS